MSTINEILEYVNHTPNNTNNRILIQMLEQFSDSSLIWTAENGGIAFNMEDNLINIGAYAIAEGSNTKALAEASHAEGAETDAHSYASHSEGYMTSTGVNADYSHAEGYKTSTQGIASHAEGDNTVTNNPAEHAEGKYNKSHMDGTLDGNTIHSVGIGNASGSIPGGERKNAIEIMENGDIYIIGIGGYDGANYNTSETLQQVLSEMITNK